MDETTSNEAEGLERYKVSEQSLGFGRAQMFVWRTGRDTAPFDMDRNNLVSAQVGCCCGCG